MRKMLDYASARPDTHQQARLRHSVLVQHCICCQAPCGGRRQARFSPPFRVSRAEPACHASLVIAAALRSTCRPAIRAQPPRPSRQCRRRHAPTLPQPRSLGPQPLQLLLQALERDRCVGGLVLRSPRVHLSGHPGRGGRQGRWAGAKLGRIRGKAKRHKIHAPCASGNGHSNFASPAACCAATTLRQLAACPPEQVLRLQPLVQVFYSFLMGGK